MRKAASLETIGKEMHNHETPVEVSRLSIRSIRVHVRDKNSNSAQKQMNDTTPKKMLECGSCHFKTTSCTHS